MSFFPYLNSLGLPGVNVGDSVVLFLMEGDSFNVVKHTQEMGLDGMGIWSLSEDFKEGGVWDKEETGEDEPLFLKVAGEGLLAELQLLQEVGQQLA